MKRSLANAKHVFIVAIILFPWISSSLSWHIVKGESAVMYIGSVIFFGPFYGIYVVFRGKKFFQTDVLLGICTMLAGLILIGSSLLFFYAALNTNWAH